MSESVQVTGRVHLVEETKEYGSNGFTKRVMVIETVEDKYPQMIPVEAVKDKCAMFDEASDGDTVTADCNLRGSEWNGRYFLSLNCWRISVDAKAQAAEDRPPLPPEGAGADDDSDSIPF